jgi:glutathione S-transferase
VKLYNLDHSPYATRVRMQIYKKQLDIAIVPPPVELGSEAFLDRFPMGKLPVLELDDGTHLPDSMVIMEYLEEVTPAVSLRPEGARASAQMQLLARYADTYLGPSALSLLFARLTSGAGTEGAEADVAALDNELARLQRLLEYLPPFEQRELHLGDIALAPHMDYVMMLAPMFGVDQPLRDYPRVIAWREWVLADDAVARASAEMLTAVQAFFSR